ncbi:uncharacterized protein B0T23DRAFT_407292 [Neurospora hispaniola]|uniref:Uncharacterized protein n=1 Tax=Neurospora hispaniola TaxID=588809 RepID=A0AAJ0I2F2_9PEZI|nr:hypothetical protein B0T23DRAFT_407292 [Neurospora hispaniola]
MNYEIVQPVGVCGYVKVKDRVSAKVMRFPITFQHFQQQVVNLNKLARICHQIKEEAVEPLFRCTQPHYGFWPEDGHLITGYERAVDLIISEPVLRDARYTRWTVMLTRDEARGVLFPIRFSLNALRPCRGGLNSWLRRLKNLGTIHLEVNWRREWIDLCADSAWLYPIFLRNSRYVQSGRPKEFLEQNILNHLLTLPKDEFKDTPDLPIKNHFGAINPEWPRLPRV